MDRGLRVHDDRPAVLGPAARGAVRCAAVRGGHDDPDVSGGQQHDAGGLAHAVLGGRAYVDHYGETHHHLGLDDPLHFAVVVVDHLGRLVHRNEHHRDDHYWVGVAPANSNEHRDKHDRDRDHGDHDTDNLDDHKHHHYHD